MADEPTLSEIGRRLEAVHLDLKEDFRELAQRLDSKVSFERYQLEQTARHEAHQQLMERVRAIETAREKEVEQREKDRRAAEDRRRTDRRWILSALIIPVLLVLLQVYITAKGAGS